MWGLRSFSAASTVIGLAAAFLVAPSAAPGQYDCPSEWRDAGVPIPEPQPVAPAGVPEARIDALHAFATNAGLANVEALLRALPGWLLANHVFVDETRTGQLASVAHPVRGGRAIDRAHRPGSHRGGRSRSGRCRGSG